MLTAPNLVLTLALLLLLPLSFGAAIEPLLTAAKMVVFSAAEFSLA